jgi:hypothetical protein
MRSFDKIEETQSIAKLLLSLHFNQFWFLLTTRINIDICCLVINPAVVEDRRICNSRQKRTTSQFG